MSLLVKVSFIEDNVPVSDITDILIVEKGEKYMKYTIDIDAEKVVLAELTDYRQALEKDLEKVTRTQQGFVYDFDWLEDSRLIKAKIAAIVLILEDYE